MSGIQAGWQGSVTLYIPFAVTSNQELDQSSGVGTSLNRVCNEIGVSNPTPRARVRLTLPLSSNRYARTQ